MQAQHRHGENMFIPAKLPEGAKLVEKGHKLIVGHSETGHHHTLTIPKTAEIKIFEFEGRTYLDVPLKAKLEHQKETEKHEAQILQPGIYERVVKRAYSYAEKVTKRIID